jgi:hypothetical protein
MERRSRSQVRRVENNGPVNGLAAHSRHASSTRAEQQPVVAGGHLNGHAGLGDQARTLSPDRKDRYRASGRGYGYEATNGPAAYHHQGVPGLGNGGGGSNANSYNQYNSQPPYGYGPSPPSSLPPLTAAPASLPQHSPVKVPADNSGGSLQVSPPQVDINPFHHG